MAATTSFAQEISSCSCESVKLIDGQQAQNWNGRLDFINLVKPIDILQYRTVCLFPVNFADTKFADPSHQSACAQAAEEYPEYFHEGLQETFHNLEVHQVENGEAANMNKLSLGVCIRIDEFNPAAHTVNASIVIFDVTGTEICDFRHSYSPESSTPKEAALDALDNMTNDISYVFANIVKGAGRAAAEAERAAREAAKSARRNK